MTHNSEVRSPHSPGSNCRTEKQQIRTHTIILPTMYIILNLNILFSGSELRPRWSVAISCFIDVCPLVWIVDLWDLAF